MKRALILLLPLLLSGCTWRDAGDLSAVTSAAIARTGEDYALTAELAQPSGDTPIPQAVFASGSGSGAAQAIDAVGAGRDSQLYWSHTRVLLLDDSVLSAGIAGLTDELTAASEVRPSVRVCAAVDTDAAGILKDTASLSGEPVGFSLGDALEQAVHASQSPDAQLYRVLDRIRTDGVDAVLPAVTQKDGQAVLSGCVLLDAAGAQCGRLDETQTTALCLMQAGGEQAVFYDTDGTRIALSGCHTTMTADEQHGIVIHVQAKAACTDARQLHRAAYVVRMRCIDTVRQLDAAGCDALGLGRVCEQAGLTEQTGMPVTVSVTLSGTQSTEGGVR